MKGNIFHAMKVRLLTVGFLGSPAAQINHVEKSTLEDFFFVTMSKDPSKIDHEK